MSLDHTNSLLNLKQIHCLICYEKISFLWRRFLQGKQTCFFANLRVVGYSEAQRDIWQNLSMDESERAVFMKFLCFLCNYIFFLFYQKTNLCHKPPHYFHKFSYLRYIINPFLILLFKIAKIQSICSLYEYLFHTKFHNFI